MNRLKLVLLLFFVALSSTSLAKVYADKPWDSRSAFGLFGDVDFNIHSADFKEFANCPTCSPGFQSGSGIGFSGGLFYTLPLGSKWELSLRGVYSDLSATLTRTETPYVATDVYKGTNGVFTHTMKTTLSSVGLSPLVGYRLTDALNINFGFRAGYLLSKKFDFKEEITSPSNGVYTDTKTRVRNQKTGDIQDASAIEAALVAGLSYSFPLNSAFTWFLVPEASFAFGMTNLASGVSYKMNSFNAGVGIKYAPRQIIPPKPPPIPPPPPPLPPPPPPPSVPVLDASILAVGVNPDGSESNVSQLRIEEFLSTRMYTLLNYVFFDENSSVIPDRYKRMTDEEKKNFSVKYLYNFKTLDVYYYMLNIVGKRMSQLPQSELTLVGCNSDEGKEKGAGALSKQRADAVKDYLVKVWEIPESRIKVTSRNLPQNPSNAKDADGIQENRRVELIANVPQVFEPIIVRDTLREANPPRFRFKPKFNSPIGIESWKIGTAQSGKELKVFSGKSEPPAVLEWDLSKEAEVFPKFDVPLDYNMEIVDKDNKKWASPQQQLPVEQLTIEKKMMEQISDKEIDRFSLILFQFDRADLSGDNQKIADFAKKRIRPKSTVSIQGFTDRMGEEQHNLDLSTRRAMSTAKALNVDPKNAKGLGESKLLYNNDLPEGRFYCRTVNIEIITPIE